MSLHHSLTSAEIEALVERGCTAEDWSRVRVGHPFYPERLRNVHFSGDVEIGVLDGEFTLPGGVVRRSQIAVATLHNVTIGRGCYISRVANYIANYDIADGAFIDNVEQIVATLDSSYGVGLRVSVLNETGGRDVPIYPRLSAQTAYIIAMYRRHTDTVDRLCAMIDDEAAALRGTRGVIGQGAKIVNTRTVKNVNIGACACINGATRLDDGTISSCAEAPVHVGDNVIADGFIMASGSSLSDGAIVHHCFIGQATSLSKLFSAHDSLFFANCACENGEACAIFGGPFTVTMHKSSLLIAGMFSFLNAGSGSNQSNHMYKLGPIHQGIVERGSKTTSDSYILWPAKIGAFTLVMGRHVSHPDTSRLPFSYLIENNGSSFLVPAVNLKSVGTIRDAQKWPKRDKRTDPDRLDQINFNLLSPFTAAKMLGGIELLTEIEQLAGATGRHYTYQSMTIEARALRRGREYYAMAVDKFMGNSLIHRLKDVPVITNDSIRAALAPTAADGYGEWIDLGGMIAPKAMVDALCAQIASGEVATLDEVESRLRSIHADYYDLEWTWVAEHLDKWCGKKWDELTTKDIEMLVERWCNSVVNLDHMLYDDARKEFSLVSRVGFGVDGHEADCKLDFEAVRGRFNSDPFVTMVLKHIDAKSALGLSVLERIQK